MNPPRPDEIGGLEDQSFEREMKGLERSDWWLWGLSFLLILSLGASIAILYSAWTNLASAEGQTRTAYTMLVGLNGLLLLFCLYIIFKQQQILSLRGRMVRERMALRDAESRITELSSLFDTSQSMNRQLRLEGLLDLVVRRLHVTLGAGRVSIFLAEKEGSEPVCLAATGEGSAEVLGTRVATGKGIAGTAIAERSPLLLNRGDMDPRFRPLLRDDVRIRSSVSIPIQLQLRGMGVLCISRGNDEPPFRGADVGLLTHFARLLGSAIDRIDLYEELDTRADALEESNQKLVQLNQMKQIFISTVSHEIKTPLTCIVAYAESLASRDPRVTPEQKIEFARIVEEQARRLLGLVEDIMDLSRFESGRVLLTGTHADLNEIVEGAARTVAALAEEKGTRIEFHPEKSLPPVFLDESKIGQAVVNLLSNAIKFSPEGKPVEVSTHASEGFVEIQVRDRGPGVAESDRIRIFDLFTQSGEEAATRQKGLGLGLYLVRMIADLHGGRVWMEPVESGGSRFRFRIPSNLNALGDESEPAARAA
jgi:signal transduction histidine kinase